MSQSYESHLHTRCIGERLYGAAGRASFDIKGGGRAVQLRPSVGRASLPHLGEAFRLETPVSIGEH